MDGELNKEIKDKDDEPAPRETVLLTEETSSETSYWDRLPYDVTVQVYSYLKDSDRVAMAKVCQAWYNSFKDPSLWRTRKFNLGVMYGLQKFKYEQMIQFASIFGSNLKYVVIRCQERELNSSPKVTNTLENLLEKMENARLCRLELLDLQPIESYEYRNVKNTLSACLIKMLGTQTTLKHVVFMNCGLKQKPGTEVLNLLQEYSGQTLESLQLIGFLQPWLRKAELMYDKFTDLRELRVNYKYISKDIVERWTVDVTNLEHLTLDVVDYEEEPAHVITSTAWRNLTESCPKLKIDFSVYGFICETNIIRLLTPGMPLTGFLLKSGLERDAELEFYSIQLSSILNHLVDTFDKKLESFKLVLPSLKDQMDNAIIRVVKKCRKLTKVLVPASAGFEVASTLCNDFRNLQTQNVHLQIERSDNWLDYEEINQTIPDMFSNFLNLTVEFVDDDRIKIEDDYRH